MIPRREKNWHLRMMGILQSVRKAFVKTSRKTQNVGGSVKNYSPSESEPSGLAFPLCLPDRIALPAHPHCSFQEKGCRETGDSFNADKCCRCRYNLLL